MARRRKLQLADPLTPRCLEFMRFLEERGGKVQISIEDLTAELGWARSAVCRWIKWLELYGAIHVGRAKTGAFGTGRTPNIYKMLMTVAEYEERGPEIREVIRAKLRPPAKPRPLPRNIAAIHPDEMRLIQAQARAEVEAAIATYAPLPPLREDPLDYVNVEAWNVAFNES